MMQIPWWKKWISHLTPLTATFSFSNVNTGDYLVGFCAINNSGVPIDGTQKSVNGWAVVAN